MFRKLFGSRSKAQPVTEPSAQPPKNDPGYDYILEESKFENGRGLVMVRFSV